LVASVPCMVKLKERLQEIRDILHLA
jgi:hypothetical protein